jgi:hypothetical protein
MPGKLLLPVDKAFGAGLNLDQNDGASKFFNQNRKILIIWIAARFLSRNFNKYGFPFAFRTSWWIEPYYGQRRKAD